MRCKTCDAVSAPRRRLVPYDAAVSSCHRIVVNACLDRLRRAKPIRPPSKMFHPSRPDQQVETAIVVQRAL